MYHCAFLHHVRTPSIAHIYIYIMYIYIYHIYIYHIYIYIYLIHIYKYDISLVFFSSDHFFRHFQLSPCFMFSYLHCIFLNWGTFQFSFDQQNKTNNAKPNQSYTTTSHETTVSEWYFYHIPMITPIKNWTWYWHHTSYYINKFRMTIQNDKHRPNSEWEIELRRVGFQFSDITKKDLTMPQSQRTYISYHIIIVSWNQNPI